MKISLRIIFFIFFVSILLLVFSITKKNKKSLIYWEKENLFIDTVNKTIIFDGEIIKDSGEVQFLINLKGYEWLNERVSILGDLSLGTFQNAFALLDWALWESLYFNKKPKRKILISIIDKEKEIPAETLIFKKNLDFSIFIFLGHPYFDNFVLKETQKDCKKCPLLPEEMKFINKSFPQKYSLNTKYFPINKKIKIKLTLSHLDK